MSRIGHLTLHLYRWNAFLLNNKAISAHLIILRLAYFKLEFPKSFNIFNTKDYGEFLKFDLLNKHLNALGINLEAMQLYFVIL